MKQLQGPVLVVMMFVLAFLLGGFAWWFQLRSNPQSRAFWGTDALLLIERGKGVQLLRLVATDSQDDAHESFEVQGKSVTVASSTEVSRAPGIVHARHALVVDANYLWQAPATGCQSNWDFAVRFTEAPGPRSAANGDADVGIHEATIAFNSQCNEMWWVEGRKGLVMVPKVAQGFRKKYEDWTSTAKSK